MKNSLIALALLAAAPFAASAAEGLSYNYAQGDYVKTDADAGKADGWGVKGSYEFIPHFHAFGEYNQQKADITDAKTDQWRVGLGYNHELSKRVDLLTRVAYEKAKTDSFTAGGVRFPSLSADGYSVEVGVNSALTNRLTGYALAGYEDGDDYDGDFYGRLGAQVKFNPNWSASADVKFADGVTQWFVGPRYSW